MVCPPLNLLLDRYLLRNWLPFVNKAGLVEKIAV